VSFQLHHTLVSQGLRLTRKAEDHGVRFVVREEGKFHALIPGALSQRASATFYHRFRVDPVGPEAGSGDPPRPGMTPLHGGFQSVQHRIPLTVQIRTPDGQLFTGTQLTLADLKKHRDLRGGPSAPWSYLVTGESGPILVDDDSTVAGQRGHFQVDLLETVASESAPPLVSDAELKPGTTDLTFDLYRLGRFVAKVNSSGPAATEPDGVEDIEGPDRTGAGGPDGRALRPRGERPEPRTRWQGTLQLIDPNGVRVAESRRRTLQWTVQQTALNLSRDASGRVRNWTLRVITPASDLGGERASATVTGDARIKTAALKARLDTLLGPRGANFEIFGAADGDDAVVRMNIKDVVAAETVDMHGLLDNALTRAGQAEGLDPHDIQANTLYTIYRKSASLSAGLRLDITTLKVTGIEVGIGPGVRLGSSVPAIHLAISMSGAAKITFKGATLATGRLRGGRLDAELGFKVGPGGTPQLVLAAPDSPLDVSISAATKVTLVATLGLLGLIGGLSVEAYAQHELDEVISDSLRKMIPDALAPRILMTLFGAHLTYGRIAFVGADMVFEHGAPLEHEPKPNPGYRGAIGRAFEPNPRVEGARFSPPTLGDTWRAENLNRGIDHIVVVMMENRSYDHVLGHRAQGPRGDGADGLTADVVAAIEAAGDGRTYTVGKLRSAGFATNAVGLMTRLPKPVGHEWHDVEEQLRLRTPGPGGGELNSPVGFVENFKPKLRGDARGVAPNDVLGYYDGQDLSFYEYLAQNYAYCDRYFCSHPGPTLPNRMFSLTGDVQHDRYGFPIVDNNNGDNFLLSRATTIYDLLVRRGLNFRVYESTPSVTMLRMFARYATNDTEIVPLERLAGDVARGDLPAFTAIEPQMHAHPQDDDHPDADMHRGQLFLRRVYETLRSNPAVWQRTLLIITYDEHGGLYDHVVPPVADVIVPQTGPVLDPGPRGGTRRGGLGGILETVGGRRAGVSVAEVGPPLASASAAPAPLTIPYGVRVPTFVVSPWVSPGKGPSLVLDHCSILKTVLARFWGGEKPFLSDRVHASQSFEAFLTEAAPRMNVPPPPPLAELPIDARRLVSTSSRIETPTLTRAEMRRGPVDYHVLTGRWARQLGR
jgi:phospholipase C